MSSIDANGRIEDLVHVDQAASALSASRRTIERMVERGELERAEGEDGRAYVTKSSLVAAKKLREHPSARRPGSEVRQAAAQLAEVVDRLSVVVDAQQRQLVAAQDQSRQAVVHAARFEEQLKSRDERIAELEAALAAAQGRRRWFRRAPRAA
jgi:hypothetical protein